MDANKFIEQFDQLINRIYRFQDSYESMSDSKDNIYEFLTQNYDVYLASNPEEREEIRELVKKYHTSSASPNMLDLFQIGYVQVAAENIQATGDKTWLLRGLVVSLIENSLRDQGDSTFSLAYVYVMAEEKNLHPKPKFYEIAELSSDEISSGGSIAIKEMIRNIPNIARKTYDDWKEFN